MPKDKSSSAIALILHGFLIDWIVMLVLGAHGHATWGYWQTLFATWAVEGVIAGGVASGIVLTS